MPLWRMEEGTGMNITNLTGASAYRSNAAGQLQKAAGQITAAVEQRRRDRFELSYQDVINAEKYGFIEVNGNRYTVSGDMATQMRSAYEQITARNQALIARQTAEANARAAKEQSEAAAEQWEKMAKALEIARRISKGGRVPPQDEQFLLEFSQEMYMAAKMMAIMAKEHKDEDSVLEDEEETAEDGGVEAVGEGTEHLEASVSGDAVSGVSSAANAVSEGS